MIGTVVGDELCGHCDGLCAVNLEVRTWTEEVVGAQPVRLDVATVLVAHAFEAVLAVDATIRGIAASLLPRGTGVHRVNHARPSWPSWPSWPSAW